MPATLEKPRDLVQFRALNSAGAIDPDAGVIKGASVLSVGPALGHGLQVDEKSLQQCLEACQELGDEGVKLVIDHESGFQEIVGAVTNFRIKGLQLLGDIHLLESIPEQRAHILELAKKLPRNIGLSVETYGEPEKLDGKKFYRVTSIDAIALVPNPAANPTGLFSKKTGVVDNSTNPNPPDMTLDEFKTAFSELIKPVADKVDALETKLNDKSEGEKLSAKVDDAVTKLGALPTEDKIKALVATELKDQSEQIASNAVTKFAATVGMKPGSVPNSQVGEPGSGKTSFSAKIKAHLAAGAKNDGVAILRAKNDDPAGYNEWEKAGRPNN